MTDDWFRPIAQTIHLIKTRSYYPVALEKALPIALDALVNDQDKYCHFLNPQEYRDLLTTTQGHFFGIGVTVGRKKKTDPHLTIFKIAIASPAEKQGLRVYDKIVAIDDLAIEHMTTTQAIEHLKGFKRYSPVTLSIKRGNKKFNITIKRDIIKEQHVSSKLLHEHNILYCKLSLFTKQSVIDIKEILTKQKPTIGLILDLRDNSGGVLQEAVNCASLFLNGKNLITTTKDRDNKTIMNFYTREDSVSSCHKPIIILINNKTASAAELFAGALSYYSQKSSNQKANYIFLLGTQTQGKGSVQEIIPLAQQCALCLTTYIYHLPNQSSIHGKGIVPDFTVGYKITVPDKQNSYKENYSINNDHQIKVAAQLLMLLDCSSFYNITNHQKAYEWLKRYFTLQDIMPSSDFT